MVSAAPCRAQQDAAALPPYAAELGLHAWPFPVTPDESGYFFTPRTEAIYHELLHFITMRRGVMLLSGDVGLGKTTLLRRILCQLDPEQFNTALILSSFLDRDALLEAITRDFGLAPPSGSGRYGHLHALNAFLLEQAGAGKTNVLIIDDAQALDADALDLVRQLGNLETSRHKLIQVLLVGQDEVLSTLGQHGLRQVRSRIALARRLEPMSRAELGAYLAHRLELAGNAAAATVTAGGLRVLHRLTAGCPRRVHHVMDRCLYALTARRTRRVDGALVALAWADLVPSAAPPAASRRMRRAVPLAALAGLALLAAAAYGYQAALPGAVATAAAALPAAWSAAASPPAAPSAASGAPPGWPAGLPAGLSGLRWPAAAGVDAMARQLAQAAGPAGWSLLTVTPGFAPPCVARPVWTARDTQGHAWHFTFIESSWPTQPLELGRYHAAAQAAQRHLVAGGWLAALHADGVMGSRSMAALGRFQAASQLERTGQFNPATAYRLSCLDAHTPPVAEARHG